MLRVAVIGGGPAGMMSAGRAAEAGADTVLLEKNSKLGKKLYITGKGRCNVTNNCDVQEFLRNVPVNSRFLYSAVSRFSPADTMAFFEGLGCELVVERGRRVFPRSQRASDITAALERFMRMSGAEVVTGFCVQDVDFASKKITITGSCGRKILCDRLILCGGGMTYSTTGSTGECYGFAKRAGHQITELYPSLCGITAAGQAGVPELSGLTLKNVRLTVLNAGKKIFSEIGEMLYTREGLSGPLVLSASAYISGRALGSVSIVIDLKPGLTAEQLDRRLQRDFAANINRALKNSLGDLLPRSLVPVVIALSNVDGDKPCNGITAANRRDLGAVIKGLKYHPVSLGDMESAVVTRGGVDVKQVDPATMRSRIDPRLYFAGEMLDLDGLTGGYNIQIALSTGHAAGSAAAVEDFNR